MTLQGKRIILGITGSIAAYKTPHLVRQLVKAGAEVRVVMTDAAAMFVSPLALSTVSRQPVLQHVADGATWNNHVEMGLWADALLIAPCSANTLAKLANGLCDNLLSAVYLSARCPVFIAPAMDEDMWLHAATRRNMHLLTGFGHTIIPVGHGELASGLVGEGRMAEPEDIVRFLAEQLVEIPKPLAGINALVTAGPTYERMDPVRFIGNFSTGKMGVAIAESLAARGATVNLVLGPSSVAPVHPLVHTIHVESAREMYEACLPLFEHARITVLAAAVADYRPVTVAPEKIKKKEGQMSLELTKTEDILATLGKIKTPGQALIGFALETRNELEHAAEKLREKNADMIVLNSLRDEGAGFGFDTNKVTLLTAGEPPLHLPLQGKQAAADAIIDHAIKLLYDKNRA